MRPPPQIATELPSTSPHVARSVGTLEGEQGAVEVWLLPEEAPEAWRQLFEQEGEELSRLSHPALPDLLSRGELEGRPYLVTHLRERGSSLFELVGQEDLDWEERLLVVREVTGAWAELARQGLELGAFMPGLAFWNRRSRELFLAHHRAPPVVLRLAGGSHGEAGGEVAHWARFASWFLGQSEDPEEAEARFVSHVPPDLSRLIRTALSRDAALRPEGLVEIERALDLLQTIGPEVGPRWQERPGSRKLPARPERTPEEATSPWDLLGDGGSWSPMMGAGLVTLSLGLMGLVAWSRGGPEELPPPLPQLESSEGYEPLHHPRFQDPYLHLLVKQEEVPAGDFPMLLGILRSLEEQDRLPRSLRDPGRARRLGRRFQLDPEGACRALERFLGELREAVQAPAPGE